MSAYIYLIIAVIAEIVGTSALKASYGMTKLYPSLLVVGAYALAFWSLSISLKMLPVSIVYAIWAGLGILGIALIGVFYFKEAFGIWHFLGIALIVVGIGILTQITTAH